MFARIFLVAFVAFLIWAVAVHPSEGARSADVHVVRTGDTLWSIATAHYAGDDPREAVWRIRRANGLDAAALQPGQRLLLP
jgi:nucleoid-associated protein YgaU